MAQGNTSAKKLVAECMGTAFLLATVVGSGIMAENLSSGNISLALLENAIATGDSLIALILTFGSIPGAHFNPAVTLADAAKGGLPWKLVPGYITAQFVGAMVGVYCAHAMIVLSLLQTSTHVRTGNAQLFSEFV